MDMKFMYLVVFDVLLSATVSYSIAEQKPLVPALFIFGDSVVDSGNNNNFKTLAVGNYSPYGIDFPYEATTGRFTNGYTLADLFDKTLNLPLAPPYITTKYVDRRNTTSGFNYASCSAGILHETGRKLGMNLNMRTQVKIFQESLDKYIRVRFKSTAGLHKYLAKSVFLIHVGTNDYVNNYLQPKHYNTSHYKSDEFADLLVKHLGKYLKALYNLGARKFVVFQIAQIGCSPLLVRQFTPETRCADQVNNMVSIFNDKLEFQLGHLSFVLRKSYFMTANVFNLTAEILSNPSRYGINETRKGCCQNEDWHCIRGTKPCSSRNSYYFWDKFHPTQAVNKIITKECFNNDKVCSPLNMHRLIEI